MTEEQFFKYLKEKCNINLTKEQKEAVITTGVPTALISTAGSGKTSVVTTKLAYLILVKGLSPERILVTSFSNQSSLDMENRFKKRFGKVITQKVQFSTIHSFAFSVFRDYASRLNMKYTLIEDTDCPISKNKLLSSIYKKYTNEAVTEDKLKDLNGFVSYIKNLMILYDDLDKYSKQFPVGCFKEIYKEYEETKRGYTEKGKGKVRLLDFDDMLSMCYHALKNNPKMLQEYSEKYDYYIVDEAQDTSLIQNAIVKLISYPKYNLFMVGDPRQSIYSWRGAVVEELVNFESRYPKAKALYMNQNFRSTKTIVDTSAEFIKILNYDIDNNIHTENEQGEPIDFTAVEDENKQIDYVVDKIKENKKLNEIAIIYRNNISAIPFVERLNREDIPFYIKDEIGSFFNHWVTADILKFFEFAEKQWNTELFSGIYYKIKSYVNKKDVDALYYDLSTFDKAGKSVFDRLMENPNYANKKEQLTDFKYKFEYVAKMAPKKAIAYIEEQLNYRDYLEDFSKKFNYTMDSIDNVLSSLKMIASGVDTLSQFKDKLSILQQEMSDSKSNKYKNAVTLSSSHSSKGLEWNEVFFIDTHNFPSLDSINKTDREDTSDYYEEARVFFVSITRARKLLHVIYPEYRNGSRVEASPFYKRLYNIANPPVIKPKATLKEKLINPLPKLEEGFLIHHSKFGDGKILKIDGDILTVDFNKVSIKRLSLEVCIRTGVLKLINYKVEGIIL